MSTRICLQNRDRDIDIVLPDGQTITLQYRTEEPSLDVVFMQRQVVNCWANDTAPMSPAPGVRGKPHIRLADQLVIPLTLEEE